MAQDYLPESRLGTTDETGERVYIHPHDVKGKWTERRKIIYWFLIGIYLVLPWIRYNGKQVVLLDLPNREFRFFETIFYGHDGPFLIFILLSFVFLAAYVTTVWGRVWCGYACPQTVFIDSLYRWVERKIEGTGPRRDKLEKAPWTKEKIIKRSFKWICYTVISLHIVHSGLGYFVGTLELLEISFQSPLININLFILMLVLTLIILVDFGWFREQFCIIACPYGRFQSIVMDQSSLIVGYDKKRGEPRRDLKAENPGDCVSCNRCVHVCPTGIDIREGLQMECIACTMCIDACDEIMTRLKKPTGLISYTTDNELNNLPNKRSPRVYIYLSLFIVTLILFSFSLTRRLELKTQIIRSSNSAFQEIKSERLILNHFKIKLRYMNNNQLNLIVRNKNKDLKLIIPDGSIELYNENKSMDLFIKFPKSILVNGEHKTQIELVDKDNNKIIKTIGVVLVGPIN